MDNIGTMTIMRTWLTM